MSATPDLLPPFPDLSPEKAKLNFSQEAAVISADGTLFSPFQSMAYTVRATWKGWDGWVTLATPTGSARPELNLRSNPEFIAAVRGEVSQQAIGMEKERRARAIEEGKAAADAKVEALKNGTLGSA